MLHSLMELPSNAIVVTEWKQADNLKIRKADPFQAPALPQREDIADELFLRFATVREEHVD
jgi:hypothetical protein